MQTIFSLLTDSPYIALPDSLLEWAGWVGLFAILLAGLFYWWEQRPTRKLYFWPLLAILLFGTGITALFFGFRLPAAGEFTLPGLPVDLASPAVMVLAALPWVLAGGFLGPAAAVIVGFFTGLLFGFWETHNLFTALLIAGLALLFAVAVRQRYRTGFYRYLRHPLGAAATLALAYAPVYAVTGFFEAQGAAASRIDYALTHGLYSLVIYGAEILVAGIIAEGIYLAKVNWWGRRGILMPSPAETSLQTRFFYAVAPLVMVLVAALVVGDWFVAGAAARDMVEERMSAATASAVQSLPYFLETGQNLLSSLAEPELLTTPPELLPDRLGEKLRVVPYFRLLYLFDQNGNPVSGYPYKLLDQIRPAQQELAAINLALSGVPMQTYTLPPWPGETTAQVTFLAAVRDANGQVVGVLLGRTDLESNPFSRPAVQILQNMQEIGGSGFILDENQQILFTSQASETVTGASDAVLSAYTGYLPAADDTFQDDGVDDSHRYGYYRRIVGRPWSVVATVPLEVAQQITFDIALPLLVILLILSIVTFFALRLALNSITSVLTHLSKEATLIARGQLDHPLQVSGEDEIGSFARAFEQMRSSLKARLDDLNRLLLVSRGVAEHLNAGEAMLSVLQSALNENAVSARVVLVDEAGIRPNGEQPVAYGSGPGSQRYAYLDGQALEMARQHNLVTIPNAQRVRRLHFPPQAAQPGAVIAAAIRDEHNFYGVLWLAYDEPYAFSDSEARFLNTLAGQAALAAANASLYASAEIGRQRLEAVLASTPEPVLVIDEHMHLLLLNRAALEVKGLVLTAVEGKHIREVLNQPDLLDLVLLPMDEGLAERELTLADGRVYHASVSPVLSEGRSLGKICMLRDITQYKELDELKSDFVATVSHDLRSPLTLVRGYGTMLQMVGDLNEQQQGYVRKIIAGVENMTRLVNNLLDLGRIDAGIGLQIGPVRIFEVIDHVINSLQPQATQKKLLLMQESTADRSLLENVVLQADAALLEQALYNLVDNAIKFTNVGGKVDIEVQLRAKTIILEVRDTGIGIAPLDQPHMFEKFYRSGRREAYQQRGTGLGLAIVKTIAERHGGRVWVDSVLGKGSTFFLEIPFKQGRGKTA